MSVPEKLSNLIEFDDEPFYIIEAFASLPASRKMLLSDHLFSKGYHTFKQTVWMFWPFADEDDIHKLEKFLFLLRKAAH